VLALAQPALAGIPEGDIFLYPAGASLRTGLMSEDGLTTTPNVRVFFAELGEDVPNFTAEPGWQSPDGTFSGPGTITFTINRALRKWNGFDCSTVDGSMALSFGPLGPIVSPAVDSPVPGFSLPVDDLGGLHDHPDYELLAPAGDGVYLLDLTFGTSFAALGPSEPVWILFGQNAGEADSLAAYEWAVANVPSPGWASCSAFGGLWAAGRRRRR
jgi:hypothetical protein